MSCRVINKGSQGSKVFELEGVASLQQLNLLERYIKKEAMDESDRAELGLALATLEQVEGWLAITNAANEEELFTVVNRAGAYHLRQFARELVRADEDDCLARRPLKGLVLDFHHSFGGAAERSIASSSDGSGNHDGDGTRQLGSFFYQILEESGLSTWMTPFSTGIAANHLAIASAVKKFFLADGIPADELFFSSYTPFFAAKASKILAALKSRWPKGGRSNALPR